jgi:cation diffusion facilitator family transporter
MKILEGANRALGKWFIEGFSDTDKREVRIQHGLLAGWVSIIATIALFAVRMVLGLKAGSISMVADAFHLLSHLANSIILVVSFWVTSRPATARAPFGHGRMEHVAPLIMSVFLFVSGIQIGERSVHQVLEPHAIHYWPALPWILLATILVKEWVGQFVRYLGKRVASHAILVNAFHHRIEVVITLTVVGGLVAGHHYHRPELDGYIGVLVELDGYIGVLVSAWLLYLGFDHGREAIVPLLGKAPGRDILQRIRETAKSVEGIQDIHEIILHDYGSMYLISAHVEIPEKFDSANMHEITERCEAKLRKTYGGEAVCHTDPLLEKTPEVRAVEAQFKKIVERSPHITGYHDFRVIAESSQKIIIVADIDVAEEVPEREFETIAKDLESQVKVTISNIAYCHFYITPKFSY